GSSTSSGTTPSPAPAPSPGSAASGSTPPSPSARPPPPLSPPPPKVQRSRPSLSLSPSSFLELVVWEGLRIWRMKSMADEAATGGLGRPYGDEGSAEAAAAPRVTRSIMIKRPAGWASPGGGTPPSSPAGSTPPVSPFSAGANRFRRKSMSDAQATKADAVALYVGGCTLEKEAMLFVLLIEVLCV
ncbi:unnamed protein product, partial [Musa acuminata subsp. burmannicoides]